MGIEQKERSITEIQNEYDKLYQEAPIRDDDRAYAWHAKTVQGLKPSAKTILDIACGGGYFLREILKISSSDFSAYGIDFSKEALKLASKECPHAVLDLSTSEQMAFSSKTFDILTCLGSLEHFWDIEKSIKEMIRVAKDDALIYILVPNMFWYKDIISVLIRGNRVTRNQTHERFASLQEWVDLLQQCGLTIKKTIKYNGIAKSPLKQTLKNCLIPTRFSYHFIFVCKK